MTAISDPDLGHHRLHHSLPFRQGTVTERPLDVADELRELGRIRDDRLTLRYLLGQFGAPGLERRQLRRQLLDPASTDPVQSVLVILGATDTSAVMPFWQAALGYVRRGDTPDEDLVDPRGRGRAEAIQCDRPRPSAVRSLVSRAR